VQSYYRLANQYQITQAAQRDRQTDAYSLEVQKDILARNREIEADARRRAATFEQDERKASLAYDEARAKQDAEKIQAYNQALIDLPGSLNDIQQLKSLIPEVRSGATAETWNNISSSVQTTFGVDMSDKIGKADFFQSLSGRMLKNLRAQQAAQGTKDPNPSNADLIFDQKIIPSIQNSPQGNMLIVLQMERQQRKAIEMAEAALAYTDKNGRFNALGFTKSPEAQAIHAKYRMGKADPERMRRLAEALVEKVPQVASREEAMKLPVGSRFITPDGVVRVVPPQKGPANAKK